MEIGNSKGKKDKNQEMRRNMLDNGGLLPKSVKEYVISQCQCKITDYIICIDFGFKK